MTKAEQVKGHTPGRVVRPRLPARECPGCHKRGIGKMSRGLVQCRYCSQAFLASQMPNLLEMPK